MQVIVKNDLQNRAWGMRNVPDRFDSYAPPPQVLDKPPIIILQSILQHPRVTNPLTFLKFTTCSFPRLYLIKIFMHHVLVMLN
jgi:hypothetical protein